MENNNFPHYLMCEASMRLLVSDSSDSVIYCTVTPSHLYSPLHMLVKIVLHLISAHRAEDIIRK